jgi:protein TonB
MSMSVLAKHQVLVISLLVSLLGHAWVINWVDEWALPAKPGTHPARKVEIQLLRPAPAPVIASVAEQRQPVEKQTVVAQKPQPVIPPVVKKSEQKTSKTVKKSPKKIQHHRTQTRKTVTRDPTPPASNQPGITTKEESSHSGPNEVQITLRQRYIRQLVDLINENKHYPRRSRRKKEEGLVEVSFDVTRNGIVENISLLNSSGIERLDKAAIKTIRSLSKIERFPDQLTPDRISLVVPMKYQLTR